LKRLESFATEDVSLSCTEKGGHLDSSESLIGKRKRENPDSSLIAKKFKRTENITQEDGDDISRDSTS